MAAAGILAGLLSYRDASQRLLDEMDRLHAAGDHVGAVRAFVVSKGNRIYTPDPAPLMHRLTDCSVEAHREFIREGRAPEAVALYESAKRPNEWVQGQLLCTVLDAYLRVGNSEGAYRSLHYRASHRDRGGAFSEAMEVLAPALRDPGDPRHPAAVEVVGRMLQEQSMGNCAVRLLLQAKDERTVASVLRTLDGPVAAESYAIHQAFFVRSALLAPGSALAKAAASIAEDRELSPALRTLAANLLTFHEDLPRKTIPLFMRRFHDETLIDGVSAMWRDLRDRSRTDGYRRRVELALSQSPNGEIWQWLLLHTGVRDHWAAWWEKNSTADPRIWLTEALGVTPEATPRELLSLYLREQTDHRRAWFHHLMKLSVPEDTPTPSYGRYEPEDVAMGWYRVLGGEPKAAEYQIRVAHLKIDAGRFEPVVEWEQVLPARIGQTVAFEHKTKIDQVKQFMGSSFEFMVPGLRIEKDSKIPEYMIRDSLSIEWRRHGLTLAGGVFSDRIERMVPLDDPSEYEGVVRFRLAVVHPAGEPVAPWTAADWQARLTDDLKKLEGLAVSDPSGHFYGLYRLPRLACYFPVPEAAEALGRIDRASMARDKRHVSSNADLPARLLAGDTTVFDEVDLKSRLKEVVDWMRLGPVYWNLLYHHAQDPRFRNLAARYGARPRPGGSKGLIESALKDKPALFSILAGFIVLEAGLMVFALMPEVGTWARRTAAVWLTILGLALVSLRVTVDGVNVVPDFIGYAGAGVGACVVARGGRGALRLLSPIAFPIAALLDFAGRYAVPSDALLWTAAGFGAAGVVALPWTAAALNAGLHAFLFLAYGVPVAACVIRGEALPRALELVLPVAGIAVVAAGLTWARDLHRLRPAPEPADA